MSSLPTQDDGGQAAAAPTRTARHIDLFATRIWQIDLTDLRDQLPRWVSVAHALRTATPAAPRRSSRGGWSTGQENILGRDDFADLRAAISAYARLALIETGLPDPRFELEGWINILDRGGFNFHHTHHGALLTGCFYLQVGEGAGHLVMRDPRPGVLGSPAKGGGANACQDIALPAKAGILRLFPPWIEHYVEPNDSDTPRITLAARRLGAPGRSRRFTRPRPASGRSPGRAAPSAPSQIPDVRPG
jgi:uncharacterized protein (TIGR02466 family)